MQLREISAVHRNARVEKRKKEARTQRILKSTAVISSFDLSRSQFRFQRKKISTEGRNLVPRAANTQFIVFRISQRKRRRNVKGLVLVIAFSFVRKPQKCRLARLTGSSIPLRVCTMHAPRTHTRARARRKNILLGPRAHACTRVHAHGRTRTSVSRTVEMTRPG